VPTPDVPHPDDGWSLLPLQGVVRLAPRCPSRPTVLRVVSGKSRQFFPPPPNYGKHAKRVCEVARRGLGEENDYAAQVLLAVRRFFPELCDERGAPHPAAVVAVLRLHYTVGKGKLTREEHGPKVREFVADWMERDGCL
jgi:hypothetical protein